MPRPFRVGQDDKENIMLSQARFCSCLPVGPLKWASFTKRLGYLCGHLPAHTDGKMASARVITDHWAPVNVLVGFPFLPEQVSGQDGKLGTV